VDKSLKKEKCQENSRSSKDGTLRCKEDEIYCMRGRKQKISEDNCPQEGRAELKSNVGVQTFIWINGNC
jgi:hypothetical protein